jgi:hypothetical protein
MRARMCETDLLFGNLLARCMPQRSLAALVQVSSRSCYVCMNELSLTLEHHSSRQDHAHGLCYGDLSVMKSRTTSDPRSLQHTPKHLLATWVQGTYSQHSLLVVLDRHPLLLLHALLADWTLLACLLSPRWAKTLDTAAALQGHLHSLPADHSKAPVMQGSNTCHLTNNTAMLGCGWSCITEQDTATPSACSPCWKLIDLMLVFCQLIASIVHRTL